LEVAKSNFCLREVVEENVDLFGREGIFNDKDRRVLGLYANHNEGIDTSGLSVQGLPFPSICGLKFFCLSVAAQAEPTVLFRRFNNCH